MHGGCTSEIYQSSPLGQLDRSGSSRTSVDNRRTLLKTAFADGDKLEFTQFFDVIDHMGVKVSFIYQ